MGDAARPRRRPSTVLHLFAGGIGGTAGVCATCPLDVVQTRLQSSALKVGGANTSRLAATAQVSTVSVNMTTFFRGGVLAYLKYIVKTEGLTGLYKGLLPNLVGVAPARAIYFSIYSHAKQFYGDIRYVSVNTPIVHMLSALSASVTTSTVTNPIWFVKTRLQLDFRASGKRKPVHLVIRDVYKHEGIKGFYRGVTASYAGASETMIYFVSYEKAKEKLKMYQNRGELGPLDHVLAASISKIFASVSVYPHEVVRTRLRQQAYEPGVVMKYNGFFQTLKKVYLEEGRIGLYGGLTAHLMRQVPNTVIMFVTYESIVSFFS